MQKIEGIRVLLVGDLKPSQKLNVKVARILKAICIYYARFLGIGSRWGMS